MKNLKSVNKNFAVILASLTAAVSILPCAALPAYANSAQTFWEGTTSSGVQIHGGQCPLEVENEKLAFDIPSFPSNYYESAEQFADYGANVKAEYTFYNPENYDVTATLVFPFGTVPYYVDEEIAADDTENYKITVGGEEVKKTVRHTLSAYNFNTAEDLAKLHDDYVADAFFSRDLPVTAYCFDVSGISENDQRNNAPYASFTVGSDSDTRVMVSTYNGLDSDGGSVAVGGFVKNGDTVVVYALGKAFGALPEWTVYENGGRKKKIGGEVTFNKEKSFSLTFEELVMTYYSEEYGVSRVDWYNACVERLNSDKNSSGFIGGTGSLNLTRSLLRWYQYELEVPANSRVVNTVTAPLYPSIDLKYSPALHGYNYLVSPAKTWAKFGNIEIIIKTPYYMVGKGSFDFVRTEEGYSLNLDGLPDGELAFSLCADENPEYDRYAGGGAWTWQIWIIVGVLGLVCIAAAVGTFIGVKKFKNKNKDGLQ